MPVAAERVEQVLQNAQEGVQDVKFKFMSYLMDTDSVRRQLAG
ncbi:MULTISPECIES: hypothetical protein [Micromonospora]|nr:hypothetical protein [Micromonospora globosa]